MSSSTDKPNEFNHSSDASPSAPVCLHGIVLDSDVGACEACTALTRQYGLPPNARSMNMPNAIAYMRLRKQKDAEKDRKSVVRERV